MKTPKIVHSFWSKPTLNALENSSLIGTMDRNMGGWVDKKYNYISWTLSCLCAKKHYTEVELITDTYGKKILIDILKLPYTNIIVELDTLNSQHLELWATAKFKAYKLQTEPFIHIDSDVFLFGRFDESIENAPLIIQNEEVGFDSYANIWEQVTKYYKIIPEYMLNDYATDKVIKACNAGVFGGSDLAFLHDFVDEVFQFLEDNKEYYDNVNVGYSVLIFEQYLFSCLARKHQKRVTYLFDKVNEDYNKVLDFKNIAKGTPFVHVVGDKKRSLEYCTYLENRLLLEFPEYYYFITDLLEKGIL